jgi:hypothetical protein
MRREPVFHQSLRTAIGILQAKFDIMDRQREGVVLVEVYQLCLGHAIGKKKSVK